MRIKKILQKILGITRVVIESVGLEPDGLVFDVRLRGNKARCGRCGRRAPGYDLRPPRRWRHLNVGSSRMWLRYAPRRVQCRRCGVVNEAVPWASSAGPFTTAFEEAVAYLAQVTDKTTVTRVMGIAWVTVGSIVERVIERRLDASRLDGLRFIGIDEFSYRKRHRYLTVIVDHVSGKVVWAAEGRSSETLARFFSELGEKRTRQLEVVTMDMAGGYLKAIREHAPQVTIVFDRFHVQRLVCDAVDEVRRALVREEDDAERRRAIKGSRFALLRAERNQTAKDRARLSAIEKTNQPLFRACLLKDALAHLLGYRQPGRAREALDDWLSWASRSRLAPFLRVSRTIRKHRDGILAYIDYRLTNGPVEGTNNKLRVIARRAFGFHSAPALISMLFLCCSGIELTPPFPGFVNPLPF